MFLYKCKDRRLLLFVDVVGGGDWRQHANYIIINETKSRKNAPRRELNELTFCFNKQHVYKNSQALNGGDDDDSRMVFFSAHSHIIFFSSERHSQVNICGLLFALQNIEIANRL